MTQHVQERFSSCGGCCCAFFFFLGESARFETKSANRLSLSTSDIAVMGRTVRVVRGLESTYVQVDDERTGKVGSRLEAGS